MDLIYEILREFNGLIFNVHFLIKFFVFGGLFGAIAVLSILFMIALFFDKKARNWLNQKEKFVFLTSFVFSIFYVILCFNNIETKNLLPVNSCYKKDYDTVIKEIKDNISYFEESLAKEISVPKEWKKFNIKVDEDKKQSIKTTSRIIRMYKNKINMNIEEKNTNKEYILIVDKIKDKTLLFSTKEKEYYKEFDLKNYIKVSCNNKHKVLFSLYKDKGKESLLVKNI